MHSLVHLQFFITQIKLWNDYVPVWFYLIVIDFMAVRLEVVIILKDRIQKLEHGYRNTVRFLAFQKNQLPGPACQAFLAELKVSKFQKQIFLFSFEPKKQTKLFFYFYPKDLKWVKSKNKGRYYIKKPLIYINKVPSYF